jgi:hypothetical protein
MPRKKIDLSNRTFGRLRVMEPAGKNRHGAYLWKCSCECGTEKVLTTSNLVHGNIISCGCKQAENRFKHGHAKRGQTRSPEYSSWSKMLNRCSDPNHRMWKRYGGRGITVCERWNSFKLFLEDMGPMPAPKFTIERINNDGNYEPGNCRWATRKEQGNNRYTNRLLTHDGKTLTIMQWAEVTGIRFGVIWDGLDRGWPVAEALTAPVDRNLRRKRQRSPATSPRLLS